MSVPKHFGYFNGADSAPAYDPGLDADCPFCHDPLANGGPLKTTSFAANDDRCFFYRAHAACYDRATENEIGDVEARALTSAH